MKRVDDVPLLDVIGLAAGYGKLAVVRNACLTVRRGEIVAIIGPNGAGKSSLVKAVMQQIEVFEGEVLYLGDSIRRRRPDELARLGVGYVPQEQNTFPDLSVAENLSVSRLGNAGQGSLDVYDRFPALSMRRHQSAHTLSGGERQMLAIASALINSPQLLVIDEPTTGLAPLIVRDRIGDILRARDEGAAVLWVIEEHPLVCLPHADRIYTMTGGILALVEDNQQILTERALRDAFFGVTGSA